VVSASVVKFARKDMGKFNEIHGRSFGKRNKVCKFYINVMPIKDNKST
jgi:hypothetical protein